MTRVLTRTLLVLGLALLALAQPSYSESLDYPTPVRGTTVDNYHDTPVPDPYRGLEDLDSAVIIHGFGRLPPNWSSCRFRTLAGQPPRPERPPN
jgi:hypothetical protein